MASLAHMNQRNTARLATQDVNRYYCLNIWQFDFCWSEESSIRKAVGKILVSSQYSQVTSHTKKPWPHCLEAQVVVPVFQRGYCWEEKQLHGWWDAVITVWKTPSHQPAKELKYYRGLRVWKKESSNLVWQKYWRRRRRTVTPVIFIRVALEGSAWTMIRLFALTDNRGSQRPPCWLPQSGDSSQNAL